MKRIYIVSRISPFSLDDQLLGAFETRKEAEEFIQKIPKITNQYGQWDVFPDKNDSYFTYKYSGTYRIRVV